MLYLIHACTVQPRGNVIYFTRESHASAIHTRVLGPLHACVNPASCERRTHTRGYL